MGSRLSNAKSSPWVLVRRTILHYLSYFGSPNISLHFSYLFSIRARSCYYCKPSPEAQAVANPSDRRASLSHRLKRVYGIRLGRRIIPCTSSADLPLLSAIASASRRISPTSRASSSIRFLFTSMLLPPRKFPLLSRCNPNSSFRCAFRLLRISISCKTSLFCPCITDRLLRCLMLSASSFCPPDFIILWVQFFNHCPACICIQIYFLLSKDAAYQATN